MSTLWVNAARHHSWADVERANDGFGSAAGMIHDAMTEHFSKDYRDRVSFTRHDLPISPTDNPSRDPWHDQDHVDALASKYREGGPRALPPLTFVTHPGTGEDLQIDGSHRRAAAARAGLTSVPAYRGEYR